MKLPIKVGNETYYINSKEVEQAKQFRKDKEIEFIKNVKKFWNNIMTRQEYNRKASTHATCNWVEVRNKAAIAAMQAILSSTDNKVYLSSLNVIPKNAVIIADELVKQLKGE